MTHKAPKIIKRYQNRKLYDTSDSCYVTLEDIGDMIRQGEEVQIIDNNTKEDLTGMTLAQIIFEEEKKNKNVLPLPTFINIIRNSGEALKGLVQKSLENGAKEFSTIRQFVDEKIRPTVESVQNIPTVQMEIRVLREKIEELERRLRSPGRK
jgi:polyhydroxyalkanoate synthesis repressor PhaR